MKNYKGSIRGLITSALFYKFIFRFFICLAVVIFLSILLYGRVKRNWVLICAVSILYAGLSSLLSDKENDNNTLTYVPWANGKKVYLDRKIGKKEGKIKKIRDRLYDDILYHCILYFLVALLIAVLMQMSFGRNWHVYILIIIIAVPIAVYLKHYEEIQKFSKLLRTCRICGNENGKKSYYCPKCGEPLEKNHERIVQIFAGDDVYASTIMQLLVDNNIIAWKNTLYRGYAGNLPSYVFVFEEDAEKAGDIIYVLKGE